MTPAVRVPLRRVVAGQEPPGWRTSPRMGGAMLVANHAGLAVPVRRLDDGRRRSERQHPMPRWPRFMVLNWAFALPFLSSFMRRVGGVPANPDNATASARAGPARDGLPRGGEGDGQAVLGALPPAALRPRRLRRGRASHALADRPRRGRGLGGDLPEARREPLRSPGSSGRRSSRSRRRSRGSGRWASSRCRRGGGSSSASRSTSPSIRPRPPRTASSSSTSPSRSAS